MKSIQHVTQQGISKDLRRVKHLQHWSPTMVLARRKGARL